MCPISSTAVFLAALLPFINALTSTEQYVKYVKEIVQETVLKFQNEQFDSNGQCVTQIKMFLANLQNSTSDDDWALKMIDSSAKIPAGLLNLNFAWIGDYEECLDIASLLTGVNGKYCLITTSLDQSQTESDQIKYYPNLPSIGICIPDKCTSSDINHLLSSFGSFTWKIYCQTKADRYPALDNGAIFTLMFFGFIVCSMVASTAYELLARRNKQNTPHPLLSVFSVYSNGLKLFRSSKGSNEFTCLNGIRVLSMFWVILYHIFYLTFKGPVTNNIHISQFVTEWKSMIVANAPFSVDSFFVVTGMLIVYNFQKASLKGQNFNLFQFYLHRFIRLTPPIVPIMLACMYLFNYLGTGPYHPELDEAIGQPCRHHWWTVVLHIQNWLYEMEDQCLSHTWYVDVDWQLFVLSPLFLLCLPKYSKVGIGILLASLTGTIVAPFCISIDRELPSTNLNGDINDYQKYYYFNTYNRAAPWIIGALLGYILSKIKLEKEAISINLSKWLVGLMWVLCLVVTFTCVFGAHDAQTSANYLLYKYNNAFFNGFARPAWAVSIAWIIFASSLGYGGLVNAILSWPIFQILNRLSYSVYLVHLPMLFAITYSQVVPRHFSLLNLLYSFPQVLAASFVLSIFWTLAFEVPVVGIERYFRQRKPKSKPGP